MMSILIGNVILLFNEGYFSQTNNQTIRKDLCSKALRLTFILTENPLTNALLALLCYQSSRLEARTNVDGETILLDRQDKSL